MKKHALGLAMAATLGTQAIAQQEQDGFSIGFGLTYSDSVFVGEDSDPQILPLLRYESDRFSLGVPQGARLTVFERNQLRVSAVVSPRFSALEDPDGRELAGIDRELTADGGLQLRYRFGPGTQIRFRAVTELTDEHGGSELSASITQPVPVGQTPLLLSAGVTMMDPDLAQYTYGVFESEATRDRPEYSPDAVIIPNLSVSSVFALSETVSLTGSVRAEFLPDEVTDSPIVDADVSVSTFLGISYQF